MIEHSKYDAVVFDWDGTMMDTTALIVKSIQHAAREMGIPVPSDEVASSIIGLDWRSALRIAVPDLPMERAMEFGEHYQAHYVPNEKRVFLFPGMAELAKELKASGVAVAVATGKSRRGLNRTLETTGLTDLFVTTKTADECTPKPHPEMLEEISIETGVDKSRMVMVGDTTHDLFMAKKFGCDGIGMTWGAMRAEELLKAEPVALVKNAEELRRLLGGA